MERSSGEEIRLEIKRKCEWEEHFVDQLSWQWALGLGRLDLMITGGILAGLGFPCVHFFRFAIQ